MKLSHTFVTLFILVSTAFAVPFRTRDDHCKDCDPIVHATTDTSIYSCRLAGVLYGDPRTTLEAFEKGLVQPPERIYPELFRQLLQQCCDSVNPEYTSTDLPSDVKIEYKTPTTFGHTIDNALDAEDLNMAGASIDDIGKIVVSTADAHLLSDLSTEDNTPDTVIDAVNSAEYTTDLLSSTGISSLAVPTADYGAMLGPAIKLIMPSETKTLNPTSSTPTSADTNPSSTAAAVTQDNSQSTTNAAPTPTDSSSSSNSADSPVATNASPAPSTTASTASLTSSATTVPMESESNTTSPSVAATSSTKPTPAPMSDTDGDNDEEHGPLSFIAPNSTPPDCRLSNTDDDDDVYVEVCESASMSFAASPSTTSTFSATLTPTSTSTGCRLSREDEGDVWVEVCESMTASTSFSGSILSDSTMPTGLVESSR